MCRESKRSSVEAASVPLELVSNLDRESQALHCFGENLFVFVNVVISNATGSPNAFASVPGVTVNIEPATRTAKRRRMRIR